MDKHDQNRYWMKNNVHDKGYCSICGKVHKKNDWELFWPQNVLSGTWTHSIILSAMFDDYNFLNFALFVSRFASEI